MTKLSPKHIHKNHLMKIYELGKLSDFDQKHAEQVNKLAIELFMQIKPIFHLSEMDRKRLAYASLLHDIGQSHGGKSHHKISLEIILSTPILLFNNKERLIIGSIARYHRRALPSERHDHFSALDPNEKIKVTRLSAILRIANALDVSHQSIVQHVKLKIKKNNGLILLIAKKEPKEEIHKARTSLALFEKESNRKIKVSWVIEKQNDHK